MVEMSGNSVYLGEDGILRIMCIGDQDEAAAKDMAEEALATAKAAPGEMKLLFDASRAGRFSGEARKVIVRWRVEYNEMRPRSSPGNRAPTAYVAELLGIGQRSSVRERPIPTS